MPFDAKQTWCTTNASELVTDPRLEGRELRRVAFSEEQIAARVRQLGLDVTAAYPDGPLLVLGLLTLGLMFAFVIACEKV